jgi:hypothetical protein
MRIMKQTCLLLVVCLTSGCEEYPNRCCGETSLSTHQDLIEKTKYFLKESSSPVVRGFEEVEHNLKPSCCYVIDRKDQKALSAYFPSGDRISYAVIINWKNKGEYIGHQWISGYTCQLKSVYSSVE